MRKSPQEECNLKFTSQEKKQKSACLLFAVCCLLFAVCCLLLKHYRIKLKTLSSTSRESFILQKHKLQI